MFVSQGELLGLPVLRSIRTIAPGEQVITSAQYFWHIISCSAAFKAFSMHSFLLFCEQLSFDYASSEVTPPPTTLAGKSFQDTFSSNSKDSLKRKHDQVEEGRSVTEAVYERTLCYCGAKNCRKYLHSSFGWCKRTKNCDNLDCVA